MKIRLEVMLRLVIWEFRVRVSARGAMERARRTKKGKGGNDKDMNQCRWTNGTLKRKLKVGDIWG